MPSSYFTYFLARWSKMMFLLSWVTLTCDEARPRGSFRILATFHVSFDQPVMWHVRRPADVDRYPSKRVSHWTLTAYPVVWSFSIYTPNNLSVSGKYGPWSTSLQGELSLNFNCGSRSHLCPIGPSLNMYLYWQYNPYFRPACRKTGRTLSPAYIGVVDNTWNKPDCIKERTL